MEFYRARDAAVRLDGAPRRPGGPPAGVEAWIDAFVLDTEPLEEA